MRRANKHSWLHWMEKALLNFILRPPPPTNSPPLFILYCFCGSPCLFSVPTISNPETGPNRLGEYDFWCIIRNIKSYKLNTWNYWISSIGGKRQLNPWFHCTFQCFSLHEYMSIVTMFLSRVRQWPVVLLFYTRWLEGQRTPPWRRGWRWGWGRWWGRWWGRMNWRPFIYQLGNLEATRALTALTSPFVRK